MCLRLAPANTTKLSLTDRFMWNARLTSMRNLRAIPISVGWHSGLPIYASDAFTKNGDEFGWIGGTDNNSRVQCILPYTIIRKFSFQLIRFRTETIALESELFPNEEKLFLNNVVNYFRSTGIDLIIPSGNTAIFRNYPDGAVVAPYGTYIKDLEQPEEALAS